MRDLMNAFAVPERLRDCAERYAFTGWLDDLEERVAMCAARWSLTLGEPFDGSGTGWVAPAVRPDGTDAVLKVMHRHPEGEHEGEGLRLWNGAGAARLFDAFTTDDSIVLLIERCMPGTPLRTVASESEEDEIIAAIARRLWIVPPADTPIEPLTVLASMWAGCIEPTVDPTLAAQARAIFAELPAQRTEHVLLATDLHAWNVLSAAREPWLMIDPKPYVGDPCFDLVQHLLNCPDRLVDDPFGTIARVASLADVDADRVRWWLFARCVSELDGSAFDGGKLETIVRHLAP